ncbi:hypothetical protein NDU88_004066 [Pleurodeles waltl]|uniref:Uncharacterized protein n=1 Tax=Pleurodeles waltl TaxID=8319 RepID=A0AAV7NK01_PLEWA|nr:hypothetical protein NDU88_004066 [Pleurodeles waltl]
MPGYNGDRSEVRRQLRGAGKREALILDTGINITTTNYGVILLYLQYFGDELPVLEASGKPSAILNYACGSSSTVLRLLARALEKRELLTVPMPGYHGDWSEVQQQFEEPARGGR